VLIKWQRREAELIRQHWQTSHTTLSLDLVKGDTPRVEDLETRQDRSKAARRPVSSGGSTSRNRQEPRAAYDAQHLTFSCAEGRHYIHS
jgi:hypothetical protein